MRFVVIILITVISVRAQDIRPDINKYCRDRDRLIGSEESDMYLLVDIEVNATVLLECHYCSEKTNLQEKFWYWQDRHRLESEKKVEVGTVDGVTIKRMHVTTEFGLVIKSFNSEDAGIYKCHGIDGQEEEFKYNYRLEPIFKEKEQVYRQKGNLTDWENYHESYLAPVSMRFAISNMPDLLGLRNSGLQLEVFSEWASWGPCEHCLRKRGLKSRIAFCRVRLLRNKALSENADNSSVPEIFENAPTWPCRSTVLYETYPAVGTATRYLPEFVLEQKCKNCIKMHEEKSTKFKYKRRFVLVDGAHLTITCPDSNVESAVVWKKDRVTLQKGRGHSFRDKDPEPRVLVDTFATLYLSGVSEPESGNYTCYVDEVRMLQVKIIVISKFQIFTRAFVRHMGYLAFILLMSTFCYCAGLVAVCKQRDKFKVKDYKAIEQRGNKTTNFYDS